MNIVVLMGSPKPTGNTASLVHDFQEGAESVGHEVNVIQVGTMNIHGCTGCDYCKKLGHGKCAINDDMQMVYDMLEDADMIVFASPVYYFGFSGQLQSMISRVYAIDKPHKATKYAMILTSYSKNVYDAIIAQYNQIVKYSDGESLGIITAFGDERKSEDKENEAYEFGRSLKD